MAKNKEIENFLKKNLIDQTLDSVLIISAPANDDADYEWITEAGIHNALRPFTKFFEEAEIDYQYEINWGTSWTNKFSADVFCVNVIAKSPHLRKHWTKEEMMMFKLKFNDILPITDLREHIEEALKDKDGTN